MYEPQEWQSDRGETANEFECRCEADIWENELDAVGNHGR
jgi:hypothetical protein